LRARLITAAISACFVGVLVAAPSAHAAFPGKNGKINFSSSRSPSGAYFMNPDGSAQTPAPALGVWSPDASRVLYQCGGGYFCVQKADGTLASDGAFATDIHGLNWSPDGARIVAGAENCYADYCDPGTIAYTGYPSGPGGTVSTQDDSNPAWSPDGTKIAFVTYRNDPTHSRDFTFPGCSPCNTNIYLSNVDGTGQVRVTNGPGSAGGSWGVIDDDVQFLPSWSPDGRKVAFASTRDDPNPNNCSPCITEIYTVNADGAGLTRLTNTAGQNTKPVWSPDGTKIAFQTNRDGNQEIYSMNPDGSGQTNLTSNPANDVLYDWLSIPINAYPRPRGATPFRTFLVPAYKPCTTPDRTHGAPLSFGSCSSPQQTSSYLTVGTPDSNGLAASSRGFVQYTAIVGNPSTPANEADLQIEVSIVGVLNKSNLSPYSGELSADAGLRITDKLNTPSPGGPGAATVQDTSFPLTVPCSSSSCGVSTTANALVPGAVLEGKRAIWALGQVKVSDGGADGLASTTADNTLFMDEGIFVP
jgi:dipeptidyl aminopeptidase/acylaminoacyl peptidase